MQPAEISFRLFKGQSIDYNGCMDTYNKNVSTFVCRFNGLFNGTKKSTAVVRDWHNCLGDDQCTTHNDILRKLLKNTEIFRMTEHQVHIIHPYKNQRTN